MNILIITDDEVFLEFIKKGIKDSCDIIVITNNPNKVFNIIYEKDFHLIICDFNMNEMNGLKLLKKVKHFFEDLPVIFISNYIDFNFKKEAILSGVYAFYLKSSIDLILNDIETIKYEGNLNLFLGNWMRIFYTKKDIITAEYNKAKNLIITTFYNLYDTEILKECFLHQLEKMNKDSTIIFNFKNTVGFPFDEIMIWLLNFYIPELKRLKIKSIYIVEPKDLILKNALLLWITMETDVSQKIKIVTDINMINI